MPPVTVHLLALQKSIPAFLDAVKSSSSTPPLVISKVIRWIVRPTEIDARELLDTKWDLMLIQLKSAPLSEDLLSNKWVAKRYSVTAGVPSSLVKGFDEKNDRLLNPRQGDVPPLSNSKPRMAKSAQSLALDDDLLRFAKSYEIGGAVSMYNLLAFKKTQAAHDSYLKYGKAFAESSGGKRGGTAKVVGKVIDEGSPWTEVALAHYPTIQHFTEMLASEDYQEINTKWRLPALADTCILCTSELDPILTNTEKSSKL
ncbi:hypothetical protein BDY17DRAFT_342050 [Neohortaea acidophila]|uniref:DUF1330 domain-containing protein n=1 Tax=Neohortaea acidophila TaxID=245834 RepID=A0A6A6Q4N2_9PEZI|nr:uncharacterized protein BDY17DRAFT_342050 [Neohortaea acidophila]KAF2487265.1 hypothetical protein BDY17DRAFT_342050 [Neohortaea acidophila]